MDPTRQSHAPCGAEKPSAGQLIYPPDRRITASLWPGSGRDEPLRSGLERIRGHSKGLAVSEEAMEILRTSPHDALMTGRDLLFYELNQRREAGYELAGFEGDVSSALEGGSEAECWRLLGFLEGTAVRREDWPYEEPSDLEGIRESLPEAPTLGGVALGEEELRDRLLGAWLGRCAGCTLGKPVEGWGREGIRRYLELASAYLLDDYVPVLDPMPEGIEIYRWGRDAVRGSIRFVARDDDIDYTILGLQVLETYGFGFGSEDYAAQLLSRMPFLATSTAERVAYRNLANGLRPPHSATHRNPYREWIGAQIRADIWGYTSPGDPRGAAELAFRDASHSHARNGVYGAMWAAALLAACFVAPDMRAALEVSLGQVPARSRLAEALEDVVDLRGSGTGWEAARDRLEERYGHYSVAHAVNNAAVVAAALLWGEGDFGKTVGLAVQGGWDTDCCGATAGSAYGCMHGAAGIPRRWTDPFGDRVRSAVVGFDNSRISELAERTLGLALESRTASAATGKEEIG